MPLLPVIIFAVVILGCIAIYFFTKDRGDKDTAAFNDKELDFLFGEINHTKEEIVTAEHYNECLRKQERIGQKLADIASRILTSVKLEEPPLDVLVEQTYILTRFDKLSSKYSELNDQTSMTDLSTLLNDVDMLSERVRMLSRIQSENDLGSWREALSEIKLFNR